jgi:hypothetical protein
MAPGVPERADTSTWRIAPRTRSGTLTGLGARACARWDAPRSLCPQPIGRQVRLTSAAVRRKHFRVAVRSHYQSDIKAHKFEVASVRILNLDR